MLKVKVRVRCRDQIGVSLQPVENLFVRLGDSTARRLHSLAQNGLMPKVRSHHNNCWTVSSEGGYSSQVESGVEFLPLRILIRESTKAVGGEDIINIVYASYNGGSRATSDGFVESSVGKFIAHNYHVWPRYREQRIEQSYERFSLPCLVCSTEPSTYHAQIFGCECLLAYDEYSYCHYR
jgi:hypothetical protein